MSDVIDEIKNFLSADQAEMKRRYNKRMGKGEAKKTKLEDIKQEPLEEDASQYDTSRNYDKYERTDYSYTEENAYKVKSPKLIDKEPRKDKETIKLPKPKTVSEIEGNIGVEDKEHGIVFTSFYNKKKGKNFNRLYDVSGKVPVLIASGPIQYKDGMFIVHYPNKQDVESRGDYLKHMQSVLYKLDKNNKPQFVANKALQILNDGWFEQSSGEDYSVYLCKNEGDGKYKRIMRFGADMSGHREVTAEGVIIDELARSDWYHRDEYRYDAEKNTLTFVKGEGYDRTEDYDYDDEYCPDKQISPDIKMEVAKEHDKGGYYIYFCDTHKNENIAKVYTDNVRGAGEDFWNIDKAGQLTIKDYNEGIVKVVSATRDEEGNFSISESKMDIEERKEGFRKLGWDCVNTNYGTFFEKRGKYTGGTFVRNDGTEDKRFAGGSLYDQVYVDNVVSNGLARVNVRTFSASDFGGWGVDHPTIYDFKNSCIRHDLEEIKWLGDEFCAVKKFGDEQFGIYESADAEMKNPLIMVDNCFVSGYRDCFYHEKEEDAPNNIIFDRDGVRCRCEVTPEGKLKPIAKQSKEKGLFLSSGGKWVKIELNEDTRVDLGWDNIMIRRGEYYTKNGNEYIDRTYDSISLSNEDAIKFARSVSRTAQTENIDDRVSETYHKAKERLKKKLEEKTDTKAKIREPLPGKTRSTGRDGR